MFLDAYKTFLITDIIDIKSFLGKFEISKILACKKKIKNKTLSLS